MKKLMIAAAIVCAAAFAQAAVFNWSGMLAVIDNNGTAGKGSVEFFLDGVSLGSKTLDENGMIMSFSYDLDNWGTVSTKTTIENFNNGTEKGVLDWSQPIDSTWLAGYPDANTASTELTGTANFAMLGNGNGIDLTKSAKDNGYGAIPEPTSGLLLLVGVAGLALRRRRA